MTPTTKAEIDRLVRRKLMQVIYDMTDLHEAFRGTSHGEECGICWPLAEVLKILDEDSERTFSKASS